LWIVQDDREIWQITCLLDGSDLPEGPPIECTRHEKESKLLKGAKIWDG
jgi:hypothetical protein